MLLVAVFGAAEDMPAIAADFKYPNFGTHSPGNNWLEVPAGGRPDSVVNTLQFLKHKAHVLEVISDAGFAAAKASYTGSVAKERKMRKFYSKEGYI